MQILESLEEEETRAGQPAEVASGIDIGGLQDEARAVVSSANPQVLKDSEAQLHAGLVAAIVQASDTLREDFDVDGTIAHLIEVCAQLVAGSEVSVILAEEGATLRIAGASSERKRVLDQYQLDHGFGPSISAFETGESSCYERFDDEHYPWPRFGQLARVVGYVLVRSIPLRLRQETIGVLSIAQTIDPRRAALEDSLIRALADGITIGIVNRRTYAASHLLSEQLQGALQSRVLIEQSKGVVAARLGVSVDQAFDALRNYARGRNRKLQEVSGDVIAGTVTAEELLAPRRAVIARSATVHPSISTPRPPRPASAPPHPGRSEGPGLTVPAP